MDAVVSELIDDNVIQKTHNPIVLKLCHSDLFKFPIGIDSIADGIDGKAFPINLLRKSLNSVISGLMWIIPYAKGQPA